MPTKKTKEPPPQKTITITITIPFDFEKPDEFLRVGLNAARQELVKALGALRGEPEPKKGRPSLERHVDQACSEVWCAWGEEWPTEARNQSVLSDEVILRLERKGIKVKDEGTVKKHIREWLVCAIPWDQVPASIIEKDLSDPNFLFKLIDVFTLLGELQNLFQQDAPGQREQKISSEKMKQTFLALPPQQQRQIVRDLSKEIVSK